MICLAFIVEYGYYCKYDNSSIYQNLGFAIHFDAMTRKPVLDLSPGALLLRGTGSNVQTAAKSLRLPSSGPLESPGSIGESDPELRLVTPVIKIEKLSILRTEWKERFCGRVI
jgi:hypothetical protein